MNSATSAVSAGGTANVHCSTKDVCMNVQVKSQVDSLCPELSLQPLLAARNVSSILQMTFETVTTVRIQDNGPSSKSLPTARNAPNGCESSFSSARIADSELVHGANAIGFEVEVFYVRSPW